MSPSVHFEQRQIRIDTVNQVLFFIIDHDMPDILNNLTLKDISENSYFSILWTPSPSKFSKFDNFRM